jgi:hypothetical protein
MKESLQGIGVQCPVFLEDIGLPLPMTLSSLVLVVKGSMNFCSIRLKSPSAVGARHLRLKSPHIFPFPPLGKGRDSQSVANQQGVNLILDPVDDVEVLVKDSPDPSEYDCMGDNDLWSGWFGDRTYLSDSVIEKLATSSAFVALQGIDPQSEIIWRGY